ncbi:hypothetical protein ACIP5U_23940 [Streptomyces sp. NPDC088788]|uniref:hypothetical protein n=1 Tax=Streptomyces sp. NPDC088788 TaxID=3365898 RepID=UPI003828562A
MGQLGPSAEQQGKSRLLYVWSSIASVVLVIAGVALAVMGNGAGWVLVVFAAVMGTGLFLTLRYTKQAQP